MNAHALAQRAYASPTTATKTPRAVEYDVVARVTHELRSAEISKKENFARLAEAIHRNNRLWTTLAANVADESNELPNQVRAQIFYLAEFSKRHAAQVLAGVADIRPLLEINTAILRGLRNEGSTP
ncbi:flagellar biosynthesis regulator FlaF [Primorskyibacter sp. S187A]|uniref:flagellar biosynthesis regulator FlaF n=1 Tax=Primorskyibacter sp. S187A TaxID=3415130 RepID=UPI003C7DED05